MPEPCPATSIPTRGKADAPRGTATRFVSTPLTERYEPPKAAPRKATIPSAYPVSSRLLATARSAPTIPIEIETPQSPGLPSPSAANACENQFLSRAKRAAMVALMPVTVIRSRNNSRGLSSASILREPNSNPPVIACIPIHRLDAATPSAARLPDCRCSASPCTSRVASSIIPATPLSPRTDPAVEAMASSTRVD